MQGQMELQGRARDRIMQIGQTDHLQVDILPPKIEKSASMIGTQNGQMLGSRTTESLLST